MSRAGQHLLAGDDTAPSTKRSRSQPSATSSCVASIRVDLLRSGLRPVPPPLGQRIPSVAEGPAYLARLEHRRPARQAPHRGRRCGPRFRRGTPLLVDDVDQRTHRPPRGQATSTSRSRPWRQPARRRTRCSDLGGHRSGVQSNIRPPPRTPAAAKVVGGLGADPAPVPRGCRGVVGGRGPLIAQGAPSPGESVRGGMMPNAPSSRTRIRRAHRWATASTTRLPRFAPDEGVQNHVGSRPRSARGADARQPSPRRPRRASSE